METVTADHTNDELAELRAELAALRQEMAALRRMAAGASDGRATLDDDAPSPSSDGATDGATRRQLLRRVGIAAGGAVAGALAVGGEAAAAPAAGTGQPITAGEINVCTNTTELKMPNNTGAGVSLFSHVLAVQDGVWSTPRVPFSEPAEETGTGNAAVAGFVGTVAMHGGYFQTNNSLRGSAGVRAFGASANSYGMLVGGRRAALRIERLNLQSPPDQRADSHNEGEILIDDNHDLWFCTATGTPGTWLKLSGRSAAGQFHAIDPARVYDSRYTPAVSVGVGPLAPGEGRLISVSTAYAANSATAVASNLVPTGATAIAFNLTIAETGPSGYLSVNPGTAVAVTASTINWTAPGTVVANGSVVKIDASRQVKVFCAGSATHAILDVVGFYR